MVRDLLHYVETKAEENGIKIFYVDTDSCFCLAKENPKDLLNQFVQQWAKEKYNKEHIDIYFDDKGKFLKLFIIALCHYKGIIETSKGIKEEIKGIEQKRRDSSKFMADFQNKLIDMILDNKTEEECLTFINLEKERIKTVSLIEVGFPCKLQNKEYKSIPISVRAYEYTKEIVLTFKKVPGDSFYYIYTMPFGEAKRKSSRMKRNKETGIKELQTSETEIVKDVLCFDDEQQNHILNISWDKMIEKTIIAKVEKAFEVMKWDTSKLREPKVKKQRKVKND